MISSSRWTPSKKGAAAGDAPGLEADGFIDSARPRVLREHAEPDAMRMGIAKDRVDHGAEQAPADAIAGPRHHDPLHACRALGRGPVAHDGEGDGVIGLAGDE